jgi:DNA-binding LytR/AlgR family response regulator
MDSLKILIVEDEIITATDIQETLEKSGHQITAIARNFEDAFASLKNQIPDLAIIDINLRGSKFDGIQTATELSKLHTMPIIYLTGNSENETFQRAKETLPAAYLLKPFRHNELTLQVELAYYHYKINLKPKSDPSISDNIFLPFDKGLIKINKKDVLYLKAEGSYVNIFLINNIEPYLFSMNLGYLAQYFSTSNFYRLSRSILINLNHLERLERDQLYLKNLDMPLQIPDGGRSELLKKIAIIRTP